MNHIPHNFRPVRLALITLMLALLACNSPFAPRPTADDTDIVAQDVTNPPAATRLATSTRTPFPSPTPSVTLTATLTHTPTNLPPLPTNIPLPTSVPPTITAGPSPTSGPTNTPGPTVPTTTGVPSATTTPLSFNPADNRFANPGFEGSVRPVIFGEINVFESWQPFYCDEPYTPAKCPAPRPCAPGQTTGCNPPDLKMGRPEYKPSNLDIRVHSGQTAQQWFCFFRTCAAGVFQTIDTTPGQTCEVGAYIQSWSNSDNDPASELDTADDKANSTWQIMVDLNGGTNAFANGLTRSGTWGFDDGIYDKYVKIYFSFTAQSSRTTIFFMDSRLWPIGNNDSYIDDAYAVCK